MSSLTFVVWGILSDLTEGMRCHVPNRPDEVANLTRGDLMESLHLSLPGSGGRLLEESRDTHSPLVSVSRLGGMMKHWGLRIQFYRIIGAGVRPRDQPDVIGDVQQGNP